MCKLNWLPLQPNWLEVPERWPRPRLDLKGWPNPLTRVWNGWGLRRLDRFDKNQAEYVFRSCRQSTPAGLLGLINTCGKTAMGWCRRPRSRSWASQNPGAGLDLINQDLDPWLPSNQPWKSNNISFLKFICRIAGYLRAPAGNLRTPAGYLRAPSLQEISYLPLLPLSRTCRICLCTG